MAKNTLKLFTTIDEENFEIQCSGTIQIEISQVGQAVLIQIVMLENPGIPPGLHHLGRGK